MVRQVGHSDARRDRRRRAKKPGWRRSASGRRYFENRRNRSDTGLGDRPVKVRKEVDVRDYDRSREGRPEHVREHRREQTVLNVQPPAMRALHRPREMTAGEHDRAVDELAKLSLSDLRRRQDLTDQQTTMAYNQGNTDALRDLQAMRHDLDEAVRVKFSGGVAATRKKALESAIKQLSRLQRKVNSRNSTEPFIESIDDLMASLRRGEPNFHIANDLAAHVSTVDSAADFQVNVRHDMEFAEEHPGYVAHGYATTVKDAYDILDGVRHMVVFEYGGQLPGNVVVLSAEGTAEHPAIGIYEPGRA